MFFVLLIGQLSMQFYKCRFVFPKWQIIFYLDLRKKYIFLDVCFSSKLANCKCTHGTKSVNALESPFGLFWDNKKTSENVPDIFLQDFQRFMYWKSGKITRKILRQQTNRYFSILNSSAPSQNIKTRTSRRRLFENFLPSTPREITFEISFNLARNVIVLTVLFLVEKVKR